MGRRKSTLRLDPTLIINISVLFTLIRIAKTRQDGAGTEDVPPRYGKEDHQGALQLQCQQER